MEIQEGLIQGSPAWLAYRDLFDNASDTPAMLGVSPYKTRNELLREYATGLTPEYDSATQARFAEGHRIEALMRPLAEKYLGKTLFPVVGNVGKLSASLDGFTMDETTIWECKTINDTIRAAEAGADLPEYLRAQMEHQLHVSGADRCLFSGGRFDSNGDPLEEKHVWYEPDMALRDRIIVGWEQFHRDLADYVPPEVTEMPAAAPVMDLPVVTVQVRGELTLCNLADVTPFFDRFLAEAKTELITDDDFAAAEEQAKKGREVAKRCKLTAKAVIDQMMSVAEVTRTLEDYAAKFDAMALRQEKAVKEQKDTRKINARIERERAYTDHIAGLNEEIQPLRLVLSSAESPNFAEVMKNQRLLSSLYNKLDTELARAKIAANSAAASVRAKLTWYNTNAEGLGFLFPELQQIIQKPDDDFQLVVASRIADHKRAEAEKAEALRAQIAEEERIKAEASDAETIRLTKIEADRVAKVESDRLAALTQAQQVTATQVAPVVAAQVTAKSGPEDEQSRLRSFYAESVPAVTGAPIANDRRRLVADVESAKVELANAVNALAEFDQRPENNVYNSLEDAAGLEDVLSKRAFEDCQGAGNRGQDEYRQEFLVDGVLYVAIYNPEYNRHDKTYYYIDDSEFRIEAVQLEQAA